MIGRELWLQWGCLARNLERMKRYARWIQQQEIDSNKNHFVEEIIETNIDGSKADFQCKNYIEFNFLSH